ncbi:MAG: NTP transferase domain-containing protein [bacterium]|jgi:GTP:adenosylcobinamide-phosphate guanylyltransferase
MVNAVILAGAPNNGPLRDSSPAANEALIEIYGRPMLDYVVGALNASSQIGRMVIVGPPADFAGLYPGAMLVESGSSILENIRRGVDALATREKILVLTSDIPLLTPEAINDFLARCGEREADFYYPAVRRDISETRFPGVKRTYVALKNGTFTGGNIFLLDPAIIPRSLRQAEQFIKMRKKPLQLARLLGLGFILKFVTRTLTVAEAEKRVSQLFKLRAAAVISPYAEIGVDVDKPSDLALVVAELAAKE